jgi:hypothetical protein
MGFDKFDDDHSLVFNTFPDGMYSALKRIDALGSDAGLARSVGTIRLERPNSVCLFVFNNNNKKRLRNARMMA